MLLENNPYPQDVRVRNEAESLAAAGHEVTVIAPRSRGQAAVERIGGVTVRRYRLPASSGGIGGFLLEYAVAHAQLFARGLRELHPRRRGDPPPQPARHAVPDRPPRQGDGTKGRVRPPRPLPRAVRREVRLLEAGRARRRQPASQPADRQRPSSVTNRSQAETALARGVRRPERLTVVRNGPRRCDPRAARTSQGRASWPTLTSSSSASWRRTDGVMVLPELLAKPGLEGGDAYPGRGRGRPRRAERRPSRAQGMSDRVEFTGQVEHRRVPELIAGGGHLHRSRALLGAQPRLDDDQGHRVPGRRPPGGRLRPDRDPAHRRGCGAVSRPVAISTSSRR